MLLNISMDMILYKFEDCNYVIESNLLSQWVQSDCVEMNLAK